MNLQDAIGMTPLSKAIFDQDEQLIMALLAKGANVKQINYAEKSPLDIAIENNEEHILKLLKKAAGIK